MDTGPLPLLTEGDLDPRRRRDAGYATALVLVMFAALIAVLGLVVDAGGAAAAKARAQTAAAEAARAGAAELDLDFLRDTNIIRLDPAAAQAAAGAWLAATGLTGTATATVAEVTVTVEATHPTQILTAVGIGSIPVTASATASPEQGTDLAAPVVAPFTEGSGP
ncbi:pilus assembly protein TadG-related protein [Glycomyces sp. NPDC047010]|uniref:pilus assembly protein TadG-related protein n=1 Tax=Glycomyces sp. NPDC047010 TaxID=3155023 RepID=UPI0033F60317